MQTPDTPMTRLSLVVPVFNEQDSIDAFIAECDHHLAGLKGLSLEYVFVNDGSTDDTLERLLAQVDADPRVTVVDLSRNFGKEAALSAGINAAQGDAVVPMDVDLQDPPALIPVLIERWREGFEVVLARRSDRGQDAWLKRTSASAFYRIHNLISEPSIPPNVGDFRLMDRVVVDALRDLPESRRFMKGLFAWVGFRTVIVDYQRPARHAGQSKFSGWRLWNLALEGLTSFSTAPLRVWTYLGLTVSMLSIAFALFIVFKVLVNGIDVPGYASVIVALTLLGGLQMMGIGILGEYLGRTYLESKRRPVYLVRRIHRRNH